MIMPNGVSRDELLRLAASMCDGRIDATSRDQLEKILASDDGLRQLFIDYIHIHAALSRQWRGEASLPENLRARWQQSLESSIADSGADAVVASLESVGARTGRKQKEANPEGIGDLPKINVKPDALSRRNKRFDSIHPQRHRIRFNAMTAVLTALAWAGFSYFVWSSTTPDISRPERQGEDFNFVAYISGVHEHEWDEEMRAMPPNASMPVGERLQLAEGLLEITFYDGAVVILEGPAEFVVDSSGAGTLREGKLSATVSPRAAGFVVETPVARIVDLGTEFGVSVVGSGENAFVDVQVFEGVVDLEAGLRRETKRQLVAGQAAQCNSHGVTSIAYEAKSFVRVAGFRKIVRRAYAVPILGVTVESVSSEITIAYDRDADHSIDGSGLTGRGNAGDLHVNVEDPGFAWTTTGTFGANSGQANDLDPEITYDLGGLFDVTTIREWGYNSNVPVGATNLAIIGPDQVEVFTSPDNVTYTSQGTVNFALAPGSSTYGGNDIAVNYEGVRYIRLEINTNHDGGVFDGTGSKPGLLDGRSLTGLSEIRFVAVPVEEG